MLYRVLSAPFVGFLDGMENGASRWPAYRALGRYAISTYTKGRNWAFAEREYRDLKQTHIARAELVSVLIAFLEEFEGRAVCEHFPELVGIHSDQWIERLSTLKDGRQLRTRDYYRAVSWKELVLTLALGNNTREDESFCRDEMTARRVAYAQYEEVSKSLLSRSDWKSEGVECSKVAYRVGDTANQFMEMIAQFWRAIPECVWLIHKGKKLIGGSIILPLRSDAYERLCSGQVFDSDLDPEVDLTLPSRDFYIMGFTTLPEVPKAKLPGLRTATQVRKILQHAAVLLGDGSPSKLPVRLLVAVGAEKDEKVIENMGFVRLNRNLHTTNCPLMEQILPHPESTVADFSSAAATFATLIGTQWRMQRRD